MPEVYDISGLKNQLEQITGKKVHLYDDEQLSYEASLDLKTLQDYMRRSFKLTLQTLAVKNLYKNYLRHFIKSLPYIKNKKQVDDLMIKFQKQIDEYYNNLTIEKDLFI